MMPVRRDYPEYTFVAVLNFETDDWDDEEEEEEEDDDWDDGKDECNKLSEEKVFFINNNTAGQ